MVGGQERGCQGGQVPASAKAIWLAGLCRLGTVLTLQMVTCGFMHGIASGHGLLARCKVLAYARGQKHERRDALGPSLQIKCCQIKRPQILDMRNFSHWRKIKRHISSSTCNLTNRSSLLFPLCRTSYGPRPSSPPSLLLTNSLTKSSWLIPGLSRR